MMMIKFNSLYKRIKEFDKENHNGLQFPSDICSIVQEWLEDIDTKTLSDNAIDYLYEDFINSDISIKECPNCTYLNKVNKAL